MGEVEDEEWNSDELGGREWREGPWWRMRVAAACPTEAGIQSHDPAVLAVNVHGASLQRPRRSLRHCRESVGVVQKEPVSPASPPCQRDGTQGLPQTRVRADMGNEAQDQEAQRRQLTGQLRKSLVIQIYRDSNLVTPSSEMLLRRRASNRR